MDLSDARATMVDTQLRPDGVTTFCVVRAFSVTPREAFIEPSHQRLAYSEMELPTPSGRPLWTPRDTGKMFQAAEPRAGQIALVIGAGSGYEAALLSRIVETVIALVPTEEDAECLTDVFADLGFDNAVSVAGDLAAGYPGEGPYDVIFVGGRVEYVPENWGEQLGEGGRMAVVVSEDDALGAARLYTKSGGVVSWREEFDATPPRLEGFRKPRTFQF